MTFSEIRRIAAGDDYVVTFTVERSLRRSLKKMVDAEIVLALGGGGPGDPHRYCIHPLCLAMYLNRAEFEEALKLMKVTRRQPTA